MIRLCDSPVLTTSLGLAALAADALLVFAAGWPTAVDRSGNSARGLSVGRPARVFALLIVLTVFLGRLPWCLVDKELNPDESTFLVNALRYREDPMPFRATSSGTSGPLQPYILLVAGLLGMPFSYVTTHTLATAWSVAVLVCSYATASLIWGERSARVAVLQPTLCLAHTQSYDFMQGASEYLPCALLAGGAFVTTLALRRAHAPGAMYAGGLLLGAAPWVKLQAAPLSALIGLFALLTTLRWWGWTKASAIRLLTFAVGVISTTVVLLGVLALGGMLDECRSLYVTDNINYSEPMTVFDVPARFTESLRRSSAMQLCMITTMLAGSVALLVGVTTPHRVRPGVMSGFMAAIALLACACFVIAKPGTGFTHYLLFLVHPMCLANAASIRLLWRGIRQWALRRRWACDRQMPIASLLGCFVMVSPLMAWTGVSPIAVSLSGQPITPEAAWLRMHSRAGDSLAVWGFRPDVYVESQIRPGVRDPAGVSNSPRLIKDVIEKKPTFFVDAVARAGWLFDDSGTSVYATRRLGGYETVDVLRETIDRDYCLVMTISYDTQDNAVRIYRLREALFGAQTDAGRIGATTPR